MTEGQCSAEKIEELRVHALEILALGGDLRSLSPLELWRRPLRQELLGFATDSTSQGSMPG